jgi:hypothetical protein
MYGRSADATGRDPTGTPHRSAVASCNAARGGELLELERFSEAVEFNQSRSTRTGTEPSEDRIAMSSTA